MFRNFGGRPVSLAVLCPVALRRGTGALWVLAALAMSHLSIGHAASFTLGAANRLEAPAAGADSVVLAVTPAAPWTAVANASWLHVALTTQSGTGSTNVFFTYDANAGATRTGTLTVGGQTLTITQAGAAYKAAGTLVSRASRGLGNPQGVAVDAAGDVFVADPVSDRIFELVSGSTNLLTLAGASSGLLKPLAVAVDGSNNLFIADAGNGDNAAIYELPSGGGALRTLVAPGGKVLVSPQGIAVDANGDLYIADLGKPRVSAYPNAMVYLLPSGGTALTNLVPKGSLAYPTALAVDGAHNVYIADAYKGVVFEWPAGGSGLTTLVSGLTQPSGVAVDSAQNVYISDGGSAAIYEWPAGGGSLAALVSAGLSQPSGVAVDGAGRVYIADTGSDTIYEQPTARAALITLVPAGLNVPQSVAVDSLGNVYIADSANDKVFILSADGASLTILADALAGLVSPVGVAVDGAGDVFIADNGQQSVFELAKGAASLTTVASGLNNPTGVAVDGAGNVYIADGGDQVIYEVPSGTSTANVLVSTGLENPVNVAVDAAANVYIADNGNRAIYEVLAGTSALISLASSDLNDPAGLTVDGAGNLYIADNNSRSIYELPAGGTALLLVVTNGLSDPVGAALDGAGNLYVADGNGGSVYELPRVLVDPTPVLETMGAGSDSLPAVLPATAYFGGAFAPLSSAPWLNITGTAGGVVGFSFTANTSGLSRTSSISMFGQGISVAQFDSGPATQLLVTLPGQTFAAGRGNSGTVLSQTAGTAFDFTLSALDANGLPDPTYSGTKSVSYTGPAGAPSGAMPLFTTTVTFVAGQATNLPATLVAAQTTQITPAIAGLTGVASSDLTVGAAAAGAIAFTTQPSAATAAGAVFATQPVVSVEDAWGNVVTTGADSTQTVVLTLATGTGTLSGAASVTATAGVAAFSGLSINLVGAKGLVATASLSVGTRLAATSPAFTITPGALDHFAIAPVASPQVTGRPFSIATITAQDAFNNTATNFASTVVFGGTAGVTGTSAPFVSGVLSNAGVIPTMAGYNLTVTVSDGGSPAHVGSVSIGTILTPTFILGLTNRLEGPAAGTDSVVLAASTSTASWVATNNVAWLHLSAASQGGTGSTNVFFGCDTNSGPTRSGTLTIAGQTLTVVQAGATYVAAGAMTALTTALGTPWGVAIDKAGNVYIADADEGGGSPAVYKLAPDGTKTVLASAGLILPTGVAVDGAGNVYIADLGLGTGGGAGGGQGVYKLSAGSTNLTLLASAALAQPASVAVDALGDLFIADLGDPGYTNQAVYEILAGSTNLTVVADAASGLAQPFGVAVDAAGNVYVSDIGPAYGAGSGELFELYAGTTNLVTLVPTNSAVVEAGGVVVDGSGNIYFSDVQGASVYEMPAGSTSLVPLAFPGLLIPVGVAVDAAGNIVVSDLEGHGVYEVPHVFVDPSPREETFATGGDALPVVLPATANLSGPFAPATTAGWLAVANTNNGVVDFSFSADTGHSRTADILLLGQDIPVTQDARPPVAGVYNVIRTAGLVLHIYWANVQADWSDANGYTPTLAGINLVTANGVSLQTNGNQILYPAAATNINDQITYSITDALGGTNTGLINVVVNPFVYGTANSVTISNGTAALTFQGRVAFSYQVQRSTDLLNWTTVATVTMNSQGTAAFTDNLAGFPGGIPSAAYYRLEWNP